jgi:aspartate aminotransferase-like enzyme
LVLFTASPTDLPPEVRKAMGRQIIHPDLDPEFFKLYDSVVKKLGNIIGTKNDLFVMAGEGMLVLDSAVASLVEPGDEVLTMSSGFYGDGLNMMVAGYGGKAIPLRAPDGDSVSASDVDRALEKNPGAKVATMVHVETPCGTVASIKEIGKACNDHGVILIGDTITSIAGMPVLGDRNHVDVTLGSSQKCFSAPPGLSMISVSKRAWEKIEKRKQRVPSYYLDLMVWRESWLAKKTRSFPYQQSVSDIFALNAGLDLIMEEGLEHVYKRHARVAELVRTSCEEMGLHLFAKSREVAAETVTAVKVPRGIDEARLRARMVKDYDVWISNSWGKPAGKVVLLGHMGYAAHRKRADRALVALEATLKKMGYRPPKR